MHGYGNVIVAYLAVQDVVVDFHRDVFADLVQLVVLVVVGRYRHEDDSSLIRLQLQQADELAPGRGGWIHLQLH